jgi:ribonuclease HI
MRYAFSVKHSKLERMDINMGEMMAIVMGLTLHPKSQPLVVYTDSMCSIRNIYGIYGTPKYKILVRTIKLLIANRKEETWIEHVQSHSGVEGNEIADRLARAASLR